MTAKPTKDQIDRIAAYREMQRTIPGLSDMYRLAAALIVHRAAPGNRLLISGAGGGREIEALAEGAHSFDITAVDPFEENLEIAKQIARQRGISDRITFLSGTIDDLPPGPSFDVATSLLVMHHLRDDGAKLDYLKGVKDRLAPDGVLIHADVCHGGANDFESLISDYLAYSSLVGVADAVATIEIGAVSHLPIVSPARIRALFAEAGFSPPREVFRSLWYRCWTSTCAGA